MNDFCLKMGATSLALLPFVCGVDTMMVGTASAAGAAAGAPVGADAATPLAEVPWAGEAGGDA